MRPKMRSRMSRQRTPFSSSSTPYFALCEGVYATSAAYTNIFVGMQPTFRQVPPKVPFSTMAVFLPANPGPRIEFPDPVPTITRS